MRIVTENLVHSKIVLLRADIDVPIKDGKILEDYRLKATLPTIELCLHNAASVILMGHIGRPTFAKMSHGKPDEKSLKELNVKPLALWLEQNLDCTFGDEKLKVLENLRFEPGEDRCDLDFASKLAALGNLYINEAFAAHHPAASTTILPTLFADVKDPEGRLRPRRAAGLRFAKEVEVLTALRQSPKRPLVVIIGGVKLEDKLPAVEALSKIADAILVGGKIASEWTINSATAYQNVHILPGKLNEEGSDLAVETVAGWQRLIDTSKTIVWSGPLGVVEDPKNTATFKIAQMVINSQAKTIVGGGDTIAYLSKLGILDKFTFVSTGGGAMLKFLSEGTLPTIQALQ